ncbi:ADC synthase [Rhypophila decipiens]|uniref:aminodeoxychorismate synthase n=1 Tax=Rhypophila decipiens TaxID=261697 RepID=A0AAN7BB61_9PEZI|nr:ADC synthase [Rhypophila decipiens]
MDSQRTGHILFIDAYDSFTNNVVGLLETTLGVQVTVIHHDTPLVVPKSLPLLVRNFDAVVIGPGPGHPSKPEDIGLISQLWKLGEQDLLPIFGVCLGFQSLALAHGGTIEKLPRPRHGIVTKVSHQQTDIFVGTGAFYATNYHSLRVRLPSNSSGGALVPLAWDHDDGFNGDILLAARHGTKPFWGVQFHPESECTTAAAARRMMENWWAQARTWSSLHRPSRHVDAEYIIRLLSGPSESASRDSTCQHLAQRKGNHTDRRASNLDWKRHEATGIEATRLHETLRDAGYAAILLDSQDHPRGRFSILGLVDSSTSPRLIYQVADRTLYYATRSSPAPKIKKQASIDQVWPLLQEALDRNMPEQDSLPDDVPFWGGWLGYISYEAGLETIHVDLDPSCAAAPNQDAADVNMVFVHRSIVIDHRSSTVVVQTLLPDDGRWMHDMAGIICYMQVTARTRQQQDNGNTDPVLEADLARSRIIRPTQAEYCAKVAACQDVLATGDSYELCLTDESKLLCPGTLDPWRLYKKLRRRNTAPFGAFIQLDAVNIKSMSPESSGVGAIGGVTILSSSPERFLHWDRTGHVEFRPIKGTVSKAPGVTREDAYAILQSSKEQAENLMIVDLIRHDLSGVVGAANCRVSQLMVVEEYETVYQLVSAIEGQIPAQQLLQGRRRQQRTTGIDVLRVSLPPGSMTGAPKKRSCEVLRNLERRPRGVYAGVLGYMDVGGGGDFSVVIRTAFRNHGGKEKDQLGQGMVWRVGAGGAVTIQSDVLAEFHEMETKAASVLGAMSV